MKSIPGVAACCRFGVMFLVIFGVTTGCSTFQRDWRQAAKSPARADSITGRWEGRWQSDANGHHGKLRCLISEDAHGNYAARFRASYLKILSFSYSVALEVNSNNLTWQFHGAEDLGAAAGGLYHYTGTITPTNFHAIYEAKSDHGTFEMKRPDR